MSAELLRQAAARIRTRAQAAAPGPWYQPPGDGCQIWYGSSRAEIQRLDDGLANGTVTEVDAEEVYNQTGFLAHGDFDRPADAEYVASWHPGVALAVADLLDRTAGHVEYTGDLISEDVIDALAVARAYLGEEAR